jgi:hypothetical protein
MAGLPMGASFNVMESSALLRAIFPRYPDLRGMKQAPELDAFLRVLRSTERERDESKPPK